LPCLKSSRRERKRDRGKGGREGGDGRERERERERERSEKIEGKRKKEGCDHEEKAFGLFSLLAFRLSAPHVHGDIHGKPS